MVCFYRCTTPHTIYDIAFVSLLNICALDTCWTRQQGLHAFGAINSYPNTTVATVDACKLKCWLDSSCYSIDWIPKQTEGVYCWTHVANPSTGPDPNIEYYTLSRSCKYHINYTDERQDVALKLLETLFRLDAVSSAREKTFCLNETQLKLIYKGMNLARGPMRSRLQSLLNI